MKEEIVVGVMEVEMLSTEVIMVPMLTVFI